MTQEHLIAPTKQTNNTPQMGKTFCNCPLLTDKANSGPPLPTGRLRRLPKNAAPATLGCNSPTGSQRRIPGRNLI
jgi:hypothetical protein